MIKLLNVYTLTGGTADLATALGSILTADALFGALTAFIPVLGGILIFAFGYRMVRKMISGAGKGKAKI